MAIWLSCLASASFASIPQCGVCLEGGTGVLRAQQTLAEIAQGEKKVLYIRMSYPDDPTEPITQGTAENLMRQVNNFFVTNSYGRFSTPGTVTPLLKFPTIKSRYYPRDENGNVTWRAWEILDDARSAARQAGYDPAKYDLHLVRFQAPFWRSYANLGYSGAWLTSSDVATTIHEIGHNLGLRHANKWQGPVSGPGENIEYGDRYDIMGSPQYYWQAGMHGLHKRALNWLPSSNVTHVHASGVYRIYAHDVGAVEPTRPYLLRIRKDAERDYWVEKRRLPQDYDDVENGVLVYWNAWGESNGGAHLVSPGTRGDGLEMGTRLSDDEAGVQIIPVGQAADRTWADVAVILGNGGLRPGSLRLLDHGGKRILHLSGEANRAYRFQHSGDLRRWIDLTSANSATGEVFVPVPEAGSRRFYRALAE